jgi:CRISPR/Cas system type I-B associated protein Csh2 (Cas7 group RAMP superfamily)
MKSIYTGLGLLATGKETVEDIGRKLARKVNLSEKDGEKIARHLKQKSEKAITAIQKSVDTEVHRVVNALHAVTGTAKKPKATAKGKKRAGDHAKAKAKGAAAH